MINKTKDYDLFKFREDNRAAIDQAHTKRLTESIKARNLLELRPIVVNEKFEVLDGQHRLLAAKQLGVDIYYVIDKKLKPEDIITMNISKAWSVIDFLNYYCKHNYIEYQKLAKFMKTNNVSLTIALSITMGPGKNSYHAYKIGQYKFKEEDFGASLDQCWDTIGYIKKMRGFSPYTTSSRFWTAMIKLFRHPDFNIEKWSSNLSRFIERFGPRARVEDYYKLFMDVYNWRNPQAIDLTE